MKKLGELNYFDNFIRNSEYALKIAQILKEFTDNFDKSKSKEYEDKVHALENEADKSQHMLLNYLIKDFLPPIDREDIILLAHKIDDIVDNIDEVVINLNILNVQNIKSEMKEFTTLLLECCRSTVDLLTSFKNIKKFQEIKDHVIHINQLEEQGDLLYQTSMKYLYETSTNPIEIITWTKLYACLENCFDSCENVADCVEEILMKNT